jgi:hypothetical protein
MVGKSSTEYMSSLGQFLLDYLDYPWIFLPGGLLPQSTLGSLGCLQVAYIVLQHFSPLARFPISRIFRSLYPNFAKVDLRDKNTPRDLANFYFTYKMRHHREYPTYTSEGKTQCIISDRIRALTGYIFKFRNRMLFCKQITSDQDEFPAAFT